MRHNFHKNRCGSAHFPKMENFGMKKKRVEPLFYITFDKIS